MIRQIGTLLMSLLMAATFAILATHIAPKATLSVTHHSEATQ